jgi:tetratricopeptide (TPR) repeat protein
MNGWRLLALAVLVFAAYSNSFQAGLIFDNAPAIAQDTRIRTAASENIGLILHREYWYKRAPSGLYRPLTTLSYLLNYAILGNGLNPAGYHWINVALHAANVWMVYALGILIFGEPALALALAALWGVHPVLTESVTNIVGRADLLATFGVLAGLLCYTRALAAHGRPKVAWLAGMAAAQAVGLFSKESAAVLPGILLLYDLAWPLRGRWRQRAPAYAALILPFAAFLWLRSSAHPRMLIPFAENPLASAGFWTGRLTAIQVIGRLMGLFLWPMRLSADYSFNAAPLVVWQALLALLVCLAAILIAALRRRRNRPFFFFVGLFFVALTPTANLFFPIGSIMAERFLYLPSVGLAGCLVVGIQALVRRPSARRATWIATALVCLALAARTYARNFDWRDEMSLWTSAAAASPGSARAHNNLCNALSDLPGRLPEAIAECETALRILPDSADAHYNLGRILARSPGRLADAISEYQAALRIEPDYAQARTGLGNALLHMPGRLLDAIAEYRAALRSEPDLADAHYGLGSALAQVPGHAEDAMAEFQAVLRLEPGRADAHNGLGSVLSQIPGRLAEAIVEYRAALRTDANYAKAHNNLGNSLARISGRLPDAVAEYQAALRADPNFADAHFNLANALAQTPGRQADAVAEYQAALRIAPGFVEAHANLAVVLSRMPGRMAEAITELQAAVRLRPDPALKQMLGRLRLQR